MHWWPKSLLKQCFSLFQGTTTQICIFIVAHLDFDSGDSAKHGKREKKIQSPLFVLYFRQDKEQTTLQEVVHVNMCLRHRDRKRCRWSEKDREFTVCKWLCVYDFTSEGCSAGFVLIVVLLTFVLQGSSEAAMWRSAFFIASCWTVVSEELRSCTSSPEKELFNICVNACIHVCM